MRSRTRNPFSTIKTAGLLLPIDLLARIADGNANLPGLTPESYHLEAGDRLYEAASRAWNECSAAWRRFRHELEKLPASDVGTTLTRERWLLPLFKELGYGRLQPQKAIPIEDKTYPISHAWGGHIPIHLVSCKLELDKRTPGAAGAASRSPYSLVQELLNRSVQHRWGFLSNGRMLYVLCDNVSLTRAANVEFDLEEIFDGELFADFKLLFLLCHQSRVEIPADGKPEDCWLEKWAKLADDQGTRAREKLRDGVESAIKALGAGFLTTRENTALRDRLRSGELATLDYYRQLLRMVYRLLLLLVAEEKKDENGRNLLHPPGTPDQSRQRYAQYYSVGHLRTLAGKRRGTTHLDLYESLKLLFLKLRTGYEPLGIPGLGSFLFSSTATPDLDAAPLSNEALLEAIRAICITEDTSGRGGAVRRPVDFANLGSDELGGVYESLLELHPKIDTDEGPFTLDTAPGHERKTTSSYYTRAPLINCLLDSALDPVAKEVIQKHTVAEAEKALLNLKVCDPACGSGHFLIAAAGRLAKYLASLRSGDEEPSTLAVQHAKRDIIARCIYGVDMNPMAVELCQVALWMEALEPGKPLSFLKHHIQCGNSLIGATPTMLSKGVPDDAFEVLEGDDKVYCREWKAKNKEDRRGQGRLWDDAAPWEQLGNNAAAIASLDTLPEDTPDQVLTKQLQYEELVNQGNYRTSGSFLADVFCAAFFWKKTNAFDYPITEGVFRKVQRNPHDITPWMFDEIARLREEFRFFHWHLAFPGVFRPAAKGETPDNERTGWCGGFDVVLGNPPWDAMSPDAKEFFSTFDPQVRFQDSGGQQRIIEHLLQEPRIAAAWEQYCRALYSQVHFIKKSGRYRLFAPGNLGKGDFNIFRMFVETALQTVRKGGRPAQIVPEGLYNGANSTAIRQSLFEECELQQILGFENANEAWFTDIDTRMKFCLYSAKLGGCTTVFRTAFNIRSPEQLFEVQSGAALAMPVSLVRRFSPEALAVMELGNQKDIDISEKLYQWPTIGNESAGSPIRDFLAEIHMGNNRDLFQEAETDIPLCEGRMVAQYDHRAKAYIGGRGRAAEWEDLSFDNENKRIRPQWYLQREQVPSKLEQRVISFRSCFCKVVSPTNERTLIATLIPPNVLCGDSVPTILFEPKGYEWFHPFWIAVANSYALDFIARMKVALNLTMTIMDSLPFPRPSRDDPRVRPIVERSLRLLCTGPEMTPFWNQLGADGWVPPTNTPGEVPGEINEEVRLQLRAEIDAMVAHGLFSLTRSELEYILEAFPTQQRYQEEKYGEFRSRRLILEVYDALTQAAESGQPYQSPFTQERPVTVPAGWSLKQLADGQLPERQFFLVVNESDVGNAIPKRWRGVRTTGNDGLPAQDSWVLVRHPDLKRGNKAVPVAMGKLSYQELTDATTRKRVMVVTLRGPVPPAQVRIPLSEWPSFRPLAILEPIE